MQRGISVAPPRRRELRRRIWLVKLAFYFPILLRAEATLFPSRMPNGKESIDREAGILSHSSFLNRGHLFKPDFTFRICDLSTSGNLPQTVFNR